MQKKRWQRKIEVWLDGNNPSEQDLYNQVTQLKSERSFSRAFRVGIKLYISLKNRDISFLLEQFPFVAETLQGENNSLISGNSGDSGTNTPDSELNALRDEIAMLRQAVLNIEVPEALHLAKQLAAPTPIATDVNDGIEVKKAGNSEDNIVEYNLRISFELNTVGHCNNLPAKMIDYGLRTKRISGDQVDAKPVETKAGSIKKMKIPNMPLPPPDLDIQLDF